MDIWKGKGPRSDVACIRDVTIADSMCKTTVSMLRGVVLPVVKAMVGSQQKGAGMNHGCTAIVNVQARAFVSVAEVQKVCVAPLFIDVKSAFASVVRRVALPANASDEVWRQRLE